MVYCIFTDMYTVTDIYTREYIFDNLLDIYNIIINIIINIYIYIYIWHFRGSWSPPAVLEQSPLISLPILPFLDMAKGLLHVKEI